MEDREKLRFRWDKGLYREIYYYYKWLTCWVFLSYRTPKIPSSLNKHVPRGPKIVGETEREKGAKVRIMTDWRSFSTASATWTIILMSASSPCEQKHTRTCQFAAVDSYRHFSFHYAIEFHPVVRISTRPMPHGKRLAKVEAIPFPTSKKHFQWTAKLNSPA